MNVKPTLIHSAVVALLAASPISHAAGEGCGGRVARPAAMPSAPPMPAAPPMSVMPRPVVAAPYAGAPWRGYAPRRGWRAPWNGWGGSPWNSGPWNNGPFGGSPWGNGWGNNDWGNAWNTMTGLMDGSTDVDINMKLSGHGMTDVLSDFWGGGNNYYRHGYGYGYPLPPVAPPVAPLPAPVPPAAPAPRVEAKADVAPPVASAPADSDHDGVVDGFDLCADTPAGAAVDAFGCARGAPIVLRGVNFHTDSDKLTDESTAILDRVAKTLSDHPEIKVEVAGHTDSDGDAAYNKDLSQRRANTVMAYLKDKGVKAENMTAKGYGEENAITANDSAQGKARNRRVELVRVDG